jgi:hypothetical protein
MPANGGSNALLLRQILDQLNHLTNNAALKSDLRVLSDKLDALSSLAAAKGDLVQVEGRVEKLEEARIPAQVLSAAAALVSGLLVYFLSHALSH